MKPEELLLTEYAHFSEAFLKNEELGERRVKFFITLITAIMTALVALWKASGGGDAETAGIPIWKVATGALGALLLFGMITYHRMVQRNRVTDEYKKILRYLRERLRDLAPGLCEYELPFAPSRPRWQKGGLGPTVLVMNLLIGLILAWLLWSLEWPHRVLWLWILAIVFVGHLLMTMSLRQSKTPAASGQWFRAGVGAVIVRGGEVLWFERRDIPGQWQLPQGGIRRGETVEQALFREVREETGLCREHFEQHAELPHWIGYELPRGSRSAKTGRGQVHRWFILPLNADDTHIRLGRDGEFKRWDWRPLEALASSAVVEFRQPVYRQLLEQARGSLPA